MRLPAEAHTSQSWRIHEIAPDFRVEDVWALQTPGGPDDFARLVELVPSFHSSSHAVRALFAIRWTVGRLLRLDRPHALTLRDRVPADLRETAPRADTGPFTPLYCTGDEWALELANRTVDGVLHLGWVPDGAGAYRGQLAVLVKPNGLLGSAYMAAITPFRHLLVYPSMLRDIERAWSRA
jgi:Protein of unknown function (DUF2867)